MARVQPQIDVTEIVAGPAGPDEPDSETLEEEEDLDLQERRIRLEGAAQDIRERRRYAGRVFWLVVFWLAGIFVLLLLEGFFAKSGYFHLGSSVLIAAIGGTTVNVIGIFIVVARYLFPPASRTPAITRRPR